MIGRAAMQQPHNSSPVVTTITTSTGSASHINNNNNGGGSGSSSTSNNHQHHTAKTEVTGSIESSSNSASSFAPHLISSNRSKLVIDDNNNNNNNNSSSDDMKSSSVPASTAATNPESSDPIPAESHHGCASSSSATESEIVCHACGFESSFVPEGMLPCERCNDVYYCSIDCLKWDWTSGGHKDVCIDKRPNQDVESSSAEGDHTQSISNHDDTTTLASMDILNIFGSGSSLARSSHHQQQLKLQQQQHKGQTATATSSLSNATNSNNNNAGSLAMLRNDQQQQLEGKVLDEKMNKSNASLSLNSLGSLDSFFEKSRGSNSSSGNGNVSSFSQDKAQQQQQQQQRQQQQQQQQQQQHHHRPKDLRYQVIEEDDDCYYVVEDEEPSISVHADEQSMMLKSIREESSHYTSDEPEQEGSWRSRDPFQVTNHVSKTESEMESLIELNTDAEQDSGPEEEDHSDDMHQDDQASFEESVSDSVMDGEEEEVYMEELGYRMPDEDHHHDDDGYMADDQDLSGRSESAGDGDGGGDNSQSNNMSVGGDRYRQMDNDDRGKYGYEQYDHSQQQQQHIETASDRSTRERQPGAASVAALTAAAASANQSEQQPPLRSSSVSSSSLGVGGKHGLDMPWFRRGTRNMNVNDGDGHDDDEVTNKRHKEQSNDAPVSPTRGNDAPVSPTRSNSERSSPTPSSESDSPKTAQSSKSLLGFREIYQQGEKACRRASLKDFRNIYDEFDASTNDLSMSVSNLGTLDFGLDTAGDELNPLETPSPGIEEQTVEVAATVDFTAPTTTANNDSSSEAATSATATAASVADNLSIYSSNSRDSESRKQSLKKSINAALRDYETIYGKEAAERAFLQLTQGLDGGRGGSITTRSSTGPTGNSTSSSNSHDRLQSGQDVAAVAEGSLPISSLSAGKTLSRSQTPEQSTHSGTSTIFSSLESTQPQTPPQALAPPAPTLAGSRYLKYRTSLAQGAPIAVAASPTHRYTDHEKEDDDDTRGGAQGASAAVIVPTGSSSQPENNNTNNDEQKENQDEPKDDSSAGGVVTAAAALIAGGFAALTGFMMGGGASTSSKAAEPSATTSPPATNNSRYLSYRSLLAQSTTVPGSQQLASIRYGTAAIETPMAETPTMTEAPTTAAAVESAPPPVNSTLDATTTTATPRYLQYRARLSQSALNPEAFKVENSKANTSDTAQSSTTASTGPTDEVSEQEDGPVSSYPMSPAYGVVVPSATTGGSPIHPEQAEDESDPSKSSEQSQQSGRSGKNPSSWGAADLDMTTSHSSSKPEPLQEGVLVSREASFSTTSKYLTYRSTLGSKAGDAESGIATESASLVDKSGMSRGLADPGVIDPVIVAAAAAAASPPVDTTKNATLSSRYLSYRASLAGKSATDMRSPTSSSSSAAAPQMASEETASIDYSTGDETPKVDNSGERDMEGIALGSNMVSQEETETGGDYKRLGTASYHEFRQQLLRRLADANYENYKDHPVYGSGTKNAEPTASAENEGIEQKSQLRPPSQAQAMAVQIAKEAAASKIYKSQQEQIGKIEGTEVAPHLDYNDIEEGLANSLHERPQYDKTPSNLTNNSASFKRRRFLLCLALFCFLVALPLCIGLGIGLGGSDSEAAAVLAPTSAPSRLRGGATDAPGYEEPEDVNPTASPIAQGPYGGGVTSVRPSSAPTIRKSPTPSPSTRQPTLSPSAQAAVETDAPATRAPTRIPTKPPTITPTPIPTRGRTEVPSTEAPTSAPSSSFRRTLFEMIAQESFDGGASIQQGGSPQSRAFSWIANSNMTKSLTNTRITQRYSLAAFYYSTKGENWTNNAGWLTETDECSWFSRVSKNSICNGNNELGVLDLGFNEVSGTIPPELAMLSRLERISLSGGTLRRITGSLPTEIGLLTLLQGFDVYGNDIRGKIPGVIGALTSMTNLNLGINGFSGSIPGAIGQLKALRAIDLSNNSLTGIMPEAISQLVLLEKLALQSNLLSGSVTSSISQLQSLTDLSLADNGFSSIPTEIGLMTNLESFTLFSNNATGQLFSELGDLSNLRVLDLHGNKFGGTIPTQIGQLSRLRDMNLSSNRMKGPIPPQIGQLTNIITLQLQSNQLTGSIPTELGLLSRATLVRLDNNNLTGSVSETICDAFSSNLPSFYLDCGGSANPEISCPPGACCTYCCEDGIGCECVYAGTGFDFLCL